LKLLLQHQLLKLQLPLLKLLHKLLKLLLILQLLLLMLLHPLLTLLRLPLLKLLHRLPQLSNSADSFSELKKAATERLFYFFANLRLILAAAIDHSTP
jgi:hypothetical protein